MSGGCVRFYEYRDNTDSCQKTAKKEDSTMNWFLMRLMVLIK